MEAKVVYLNTEFISWCVLCRRNNFRITGSRIDQAHLIYNLNKSEELEAQKRLLFFNKNILICFKCVGKNSHKEHLWSAILSLPELPDLDPKKEYEFEINNLCYL